MIKKFRWWNFFNYILKNIHNIKNVHLYLFKNSKNILKS
jgi:hypothetical protein